MQHDIRDVNTIFKDLAVLVHEQGETIGKAELFMSNLPCPVRSTVFRILVK